MIKRYNLGSRWTDTPCSGDRQVADMRIAEDGHFVTYEDYRDLEADYDLQCQCRDMYRQESIDLKAKIDKLKKYFTSANDIEVERATIPAKDFWAILEAEPPTFSKTWDMNEPGAMDDMVGVMMDIFYPKESK